MMVIYYEMPAQEANYLKRFRPHSGLSAQVYKEAEDGNFEKEEAYNHLIEWLNHISPFGETWKIFTKAYELADEAHKEQKRVNGDPYILPSP